MHEKVIEEVIERCSGGGGRGIEEILLLQCLTNPQGMDPNLLPILLLAGSSGRRGRMDRLALVAILMQQQQAQAAAATATASGVTPPPSTSSNILPLLLALGLFGEEREAYYPPRRGYWRPEDVGPEGGEKRKEDMDAA